MKTVRSLIAMALFFSATPLVAEEDAWTRQIKDRAERGKLQDAYQNVRGDSGKWRDEPGLQLAPPLASKPPKMNLDDWADQWLEKDYRPTAGDESWLIFRTRQLDDNDRLWVERIERKGSEFTIVLKEAIWEGRYFKTFTYYGVYGINLGKLSPGKYQARWVVEPLAFKQFDGDGRPLDNWPKDERPVEKKPVELRLEFTVAPAAASGDR